MFMIWFIGFLSVIAYRVFYAGMNAKSLFYKVSPYSSDMGKLILNEHVVVTYAFLTVVAALSWMISLPVIGIFKLGKRYAKDNAA